MEFFVQIDAFLLLMLLAAAFVAGFIDSIAGGGGMITIPALLLAGVSPLEVLGTNKLQGSFGSFSAAYYFHKKGLVNLWEKRYTIVAIFIASIIGSILVQFIDNSLLMKVIPILLMIFALYFLFSPKISDEESKKRTTDGVLLAVVAFVGFYDGFFGPGTGSFFLASMVFLGGLGVTKALAHSKAYNFTSNIASIIVFASLGNVLWGVGFFMAIGQSLGAYFGSKTAFKYGAKIIKPLVVSVSLIVCAKLLYEQYF